MADRKALPIADNLMCRTNLLSHVVLTRYQNQSIIIHLLVFNHASTSFIPIDDFRVALYVVMSAIITEIAAPAQTTTATITVRASKNNASMSMLASGGYEAPGMPKIEDPYKKRRWQLEHMAGAFRVFARKGFTEGTAGHISVRDPVDPSTFWINP